MQYSLYVVHRVTVALHQLHQHYKDRFGIETSYRLKNHCRIRTSSKNPVTRFPLCGPGVSFGESLGLFIVVLCQSNRNGVDGLFIESY